MLVSLKAGDIDFRFRLSSAGGELLSHYCAKPSARYLLLTIPVTVSPCSEDPFPFYTIAIFYFLFL